MLQVNVAALTKHEGDAYRDLPGGRIDRNETSSLALQREIEEEAGIVDVTIGENVGTFLASIRIPHGENDYGLFLSVFLCEVVDSKVVLSSEHIAYEWVEKDALCERLSYKYPADFLEKLSALL